MRLKEIRLVKMTRAWVAIISAGILWGTIGLYVRELRAFGFSSLDIVTLRAMSTLFWLLLFIIFIQRRRPVVPRWSWPYFLGTGLFSMALFNWAYFQAMHLVTLSIAAALLYTGPAFVVLMARVFLREPLTRLKWVAVFLTMLGTVLVSDVRGSVLNHMLLSTSIQSSDVFWGLFFGLLSGFAYGLYSIIAKPLTRRLDSVMIVFYTFAVTAVVLLPLTQLWKKLDVLLSFENGCALCWVLGLGLFPSALAYILYTYGLNKESAGRAALLTMIEPVVAVLIGALVFHDHLSKGQWLGIMAILSAVLLLGRATEASFKAYE
ncbi:MAG: EamA family transporter [Candidatus Carbobacillus sp.]|nr:EamA family transporter [Candidatus Carbobacillus sp.]